MKRKKIVIVCLAFIHTVTGAGFAFLQAFNGIEVPAYKISENLETGEFVFRSKPLLPVVSDSPQEVGKIDFDQDYDYKKARKRFPRIRSNVETPKGTACVIDYNVISEDVYVELEAGGRASFSIAELSEAKTKAETQVRKSGQNDRSS